MISVTCHPRIGGRGLCEAWEVPYNRPTLRKSSYSADISMNSVKLKGKMKPVCRLFVIVAVMMVAGCVKDGKIGGMNGEGLKAGDILPDFEVVMNDGSVVSDDGLRGNVSVVMFFHTTCPDCREVLPIMQEIQDEYLSKGIIFALVSREEPEESISAYSGRYPFTNSGDIRSLRW